MSRIYVILLIFIPFCTYATKDGLWNDRNALLTFLSGINEDPSNALANWNPTNINTCSWNGVICNDSRVVQLLLNDTGLRGVISPALANLSLLTVLDLSGNFFSGEIPYELGALSQLTELSLASNNLASSIPSSLGLLKKMDYLDLNQNQLTGSIPDTFFCNCTSLRYIDLSNNSLSGKITMKDHCTIKNLRFLNLWSNHLEGPIPYSMSNFSALEWIDFESNYLTGEVPTVIFDKMPYLKYLHLSYNNLSTSTIKFDAFFKSLRNCTYLKELELAGNNFMSQIPLSVSSLPISLHQLHLEDNLLFGPIPANISNLLNLTYLNLSNNYLNGSIPPDISKLRRLERFYLSDNLLSGVIPVSIGDMSQLGLVDLSRNFLSGSIPDNISNLKQLRRLMLHNNKFSGTIPSGLGKCYNLEILDLSFNQLTGNLSSVARLTGLKFYLNASNNYLSGTLPIELSKIDMITALDLSSNKISGSIPSQIESCIELEYLNLSSNFLQGKLPDSIGALPNLKTLDISSNKLSGAIPKTIQESSTLRQLNVSFNNFSGVIQSQGAFASLSDSSFLGNPLLCGSATGKLSCTNKRAHHHVLLPILLSLIGSSSTFMAYFFVYPMVMKSRKKTKALSFQCSMKDDEEQSMKDHPRISYRELLVATGGFSETNLIGAGRFGKVYKGITLDGTRIAVKVLNLKTGEKEISDSFKRECDILKRTRHRNLIKIITTCSKPDFKALVLPLMQNGNLDGHLYPNDGSSCKLSLVQLLSIASDIAEGIAYLHHYSPVKVVHCDLKPSNVLLDENMTAIVSDFGISKLVKGERYDDCCSSDKEPTSCISTTGLLHGSVGYIAPEYGLGGQPSVQGDVYSFGVLLLEMITGRRPTDVVFHEGLTLQEWVKNNYQYKYNIDPLTSNAYSIESCLLYDETLYVTKLKRDVILETVELGIACTHFAPALRPTMVDVAHEIALLKADLLRHDIDPSLLASLSFK